MYIRQLSITVNFTLQSHNQYWMGLELVKELVIAVIGISAHSCHFSDHATYRKGALSRLVPILETLLYITSIKLYSY